VNLRPAAKSARGCTTKPLRPRALSRHRNDGSRYAHDQRGGHRADGPLAERARSPGGDRVRRLARPRTAKRQVEAIARGDQVVALVRAAGRCSARSGPQREYRPGRARVCHLGHVLTGIRAPLRRAAVVTNPTHYAAGNVSSCPDGNPGPSLTSRTKDLVVYITHVIEHCDRAPGMRSLTTCQTTAGRNAATRS
jgi:hypothetical protein